MDWEAFAEAPLQSADDLRRQLTDRAVTDEDFRSRLMSNPKGAISDELGIDLPDDIDVVVHQSDANTLHLALPVSEIGEEQLEAIAAGRCCC